MVVEHIIVRQLRNFSQNKRKHFPKANAIARNYI